MTDLPFRQGFYPWHIGGGHESLVKGFYSWQIGVGHEYLVKGFYSWQIGVGHESFCVWVVIISAQSLRRAADPDPSLSQVSDHLFCWIFKAF